MFKQWWNYLMKHFSECILNVKWHITVLRLFIHFKFHHGKEIKELLNLSMTHKFLLIYLVKLKCHWKAIPRSYWMMQMIRVLMLMFLLCLFYMCIKRHKINNDNVMACVIKKAKLKGGGQISKNRVNPQLFGGCFWLSPGIPGTIVLTCGQRRMNLSCRWFKIQWLMSHTSSEALCTCLSTYVIKNMQIYGLQLI